MKVSISFSRMALRGSGILGALALAACFFGEDNPVPDTGKPIAVSPCVDVPAGVRAEADSLVAAGNDAMVGNFQFWFDESGDWWEAKSRSPQGALNSYDKALAVAPGHCQAVFGKAMASASMITQEKKMDDFIRKMEALDEPTDGKVPLDKKSSFAGVFKTSPDQAAPALVKLSARLQQVDRPSIAEAQALIESVIMPKLDSTIAALETIMDYSLFAVRFNMDGDTVEIDRGEIGPGLAGLKVAKAWLTVVAGYNLDPAPGGDYEWYKTLDGIDMEDFDNLTPDQTRALDHLTGLFKTTSPFTRMKPAYAARIQGIPALLLSAVGDAQKGIESAIAEARSGDPQRYDIWRAGQGEDADADTTDLRGVIELLERSKKYLTGEVPVEYARGTRHLKVNFTRLFQIDGVQNLLPYFKFNQYSAWNDTVEADTSWSGSYLGEETRKEILATLGYGAFQPTYDMDFNQYISVRDSLAFDPAVGFSGRVVARKVVLGQQKRDPVSGMSGFTSTVLAVLKVDSAAPCTHAFTRHFKVVQDPANPKDVQTVADQSQGLISLSTCRVQNGEAEFISWIDAETRGPMVFTDAAGTETLAIPQFDEIDDPLELNGKVVFRDPTFGGVLPGLTNQSLWEHVSALQDGPGDRVVRECRQIEVDGWWEEKCTSTLPANPSDLDYLVHYLDWMDRIF